MRILALENELTSMRGGQEISLLDVCRGLAGKGHQVTLAYVTPGDLEDEYRRICHRIVRIRTYSIDRSRTVASLRDFLDSLWAVRGARPDVVYANQYQDSLFAGIAGRLLRTPVRLPSSSAAARRHVHAIPARHEPDDATRRNLRADET